MNSRQRRSIARMVQRVEMSGWQDRREMNMCFPWVPYRIGRKGGIGRRGIDELRASKRPVMMRSNTSARESERTGHQGLFM